LGVIEIGVAGVQRAATAARGKRRIRPQIAGEGHYGPGAGLSDANRKYSHNDRQPLLYHGFRIPFRITETSVVLGHY
jgi:hypothetical protein